MCVYNVQMFMHAERTSIIYTLPFIYSAERSA